MLPGFPSRRFRRSDAAKRPNSINRVFSSLNLQPKLCQPLLKLFQEPLSICPVLEAGDEIVFA